MVASDKDIFIFKLLYENIFQNFSPYSSSTLDLVSFAQLECNTTAVKYLKKQAYNPASNVVFSDSELLQFEKQTASLCSKR